MVEAPGFKPVPQAFRIASFAIGLSDFPMSATPEQQINNAVQAVFAKAAADPVFRKLCISNPRAAIKQAADIDSPEWLKVKFVDGADADLTFVLPKPASTSGELRDEDLERVSGGDAKTFSDVLLNIKQKQREEEAAQAHARAISPIPTTTAPVPGLSGNMASVKKSLGGGG
jgi:hypothetical protein